MRFLLGIVGEERFSADWRVLALHLTGNNEEEDMDSHPARLPSATPGKGEGPAESYKERVIRYRAEAHSLRAAVKALEGEISQRRTSHSDSDKAACKAA